MEIKIKKLNENAIIPTRGSEQAAGYDLYACIPERILINPHKTVKIGTGLSMEIPEGYFGAIFARSGLATKQGIRPANCVGVCDSDYRGEYIVALYNDTNGIKMVEPNDRIAQLIVMPYLSVDFKEVNELSDTNRGVGGFGSTGKAWLGVSIHLVYDLINKGLLPALKLGSLKIRKETLDEFTKKYEGMDLSDLDHIKELNIA